jgi:hypothetical protein
MRELVRVALRLFVVFAVFLLVSAIPSFTRSVAGALMASHLEAIRTSSFLVVLAFLITWILLAIFLILLWTKASSISLFMLRDNADAPIPEASIDHQKVLSIGLIVLGIYFIMTTIPDLMRDVLVRISEGKPSSNLANDALRASVGIFTNTLKLGMSVALILGVKKIVSLIRVDTLGSRDRKNGKT